MDGVRFERGGAGAAVGLLTLDRPAALNAIDTALARRLAAVCAEVAGDPQIQAVVLAGSGERAFCAGADLKERAQMDDADLLAQRPVFRAAFGGLLELPQPVIASVHGYALGGGCELALSCDVIVADATAVFALPEVTVGLVPGGGGTQLLPRRIGPGRAAELIFTGRRVEAPEAGRIGLADHVVPAGTAHQRALAVAESISRNAPLSVKSAKSALRDGAGLPLAQALAAEDAAWRRAATSADRREGIAAFNEKRKPAWRGE